MQTLDQIRATSEKRFLDMYQALAEKGYGPLDGEVAKVLKFRPQAIVKLPFEQRARKARSILLSTRNAELAYEFLGSYLLKAHKSLVIGFLDATGVEHEDGMVQDLDGHQPDAKKLKKAVEELDQEFESEDVTAYLSLCAQQWPQVEKLDALWRSRLPEASGEKSAKS